MPLLDDVQRKFKDIKAVQEWVLESRSREYRRPIDLKRAVRKARMDLQACREINQEGRWRKQMAVAEEMLCELFLHDGPLERSIVSDLADSAEFDQMSSSEASKLFLWMSGQLRNNRPVSYSEAIRAFASDQAVLGWLVERAKNQPPAPRERSRLCRIALGEFRRARRKCRLP